jgi:DNA-binding transcriptional LysR family regulator
MQDLKGIDLHLLACFDALVSEGSVTRAAERMQLSQPAMSQTLNRLRELFRDPLLVRTGRGMVATPRALELRSVVRDTLRAFTQALSDGTEFDASTTKARLALAVTDYTVSILMPSLLPLLRREAPGLQLLLVTPDPSRVREWLENGDVDLMVGYLRELSEGLRAVELFRDQMCCLASGQHPSIHGNIDLDGFISCGHVCRGNASTSQFAVEEAIDLALERIGRHRQVMLRTPSAFGMAQAVAHSDLLGCMAHTGAPIYASILGLQVLALPFEVPPLAVSMVWHERTHRQPAAKWFRESIRRCNAWARVTNAHAAGLTVASASCSVGGEPPR